MTGTQEALNRTLLLTRDFVRDDEATEAEILAALTSTKVAIVSDGKNVSCPMGQALVSTLVGQVLGYGASVRLVFPEIAMAGPQPPLLGNRFRTAIEEFGRDVVPDVRVEVATSTAEDDLVFVIGDSAWDGPHADAWRVSASDWHGQMASPSAVFPAIVGTFPIGALAAATIAAAEPFKFALRTLLNAKNVSRVHDELHRVRHSTVVLGDGHVSAATIAVGKVDFVSGGAITNAALHALLRVPGLLGDFRVIEPERLDLSNANRYALMRRSFVGWRKIDALAIWQRAGISISGIAARFETSTLGMLGPLADRVIVGTDDIPSRWEVQRAFPRWLGVGATAHFTAVASHHVPMQPCAGCLHPTDDDVVAPIATLSFVSYWAGLLVAARLVQDGLGANLPVEKQAVDICALRTDARHGIWWRPVPRLTRCPVCKGGNS